MKKRSVILLSLLVLGFAGCGNTENQIDIPSEHWKDIDVRIETHPNPPVAGMTEIVAIATGPHGRPVGDMIVSMRANDSMPWVQSIQDGRIGVYRRAVDLGEAASAVKLQVRLQQGEEQAVMLFPMTLLAK